MQSSTRRMGLRLLHSSEGIAVQTLHYLAAYRLSFLSCHACTTIP